ncbi:MAG TPA: hypothetical protein PK141_15605 [Polyangiaceae bacterium]|nr:hypothetical protein [Polyangiaceae bacterium]
MRRLVPTTLALATLTLAFTPANASADEPAAPTADDARTRGKELFDAALADVKVENYKAACPKFRASYDADPKASTLLNLGTCYERNGQVASAWGAFSNAIVAARKAGRDEWAAQAEERVRALARRLVRLTVVVSPQARTEGLVVERDTTRLSESEWGLAMAVDPGEHVIRARAPGYVTWSTRITVTEGATPAPVAVPRLTAEKKSMVVGPGVAPSPRFWTPTRIGGATLAGVGLVGIGVGAAVAVLAKGKYDSSTRFCPQKDSCFSADAVAENEAAFNLATGATVATVLGAIATAAGVALIVWAPDKKTYAFNVAPATGPGYAGLSAAGSF